MALDLDVTRILNRMNTALGARAIEDERLDRYYNGTQRLRQMGIAVPAKLRDFETLVNWPRLVVDALNTRLQVKSFLSPDGEKADSILEGWKYNNLDSESRIAHLEALIFGRSFVVVGSNAEDPTHPLVTVESPREITVDIDPRTRRITRALRLYGSEDLTAMPWFATLYEENRTTWFERTESGRWVEDRRDDHRLGRVPIVMMVNRRRAGDFRGVSEMADTIDLTNAGARALTNLQVGQETHAIPARNVAGASKGDFVGADGKPLPIWESYFTAIMATANKDAKFGQFEASDLKNFTETIRFYEERVARVSRMPLFQIGPSTGNPPSGDGIRAAEAGHVQLAEEKCLQFGDSWGWVMSLYERFRTGEWVNGNAVETVWHDPATPTVSARADAIVKLSGGKPILSVEGAWDEMGWSEARKNTERERLEAESMDYFQIAQKPLNVEVADDADAEGSV